MVNLTKKQIEDYAQKIYKGESVDIKPEDTTEQDRIAITNRVYNLKQKATPSKTSPENDPDKKIGIEGKPIDGEDNDNDDEADEELEKQTRLADDNVEQPGQLAGGIDIPDGYNLIATIISGAGDNAQPVAVKDVLENAKIENMSNNLVSCVFDRSVYGKRDTGTVSARIIHDGGSRAYVFRRDDEDSDTTFFYCVLSHQSLPIA